MLANILLVEPIKNSKFPPLGLMKIAEYHRTIKGDNVTFVKGPLPETIRQGKWDKAYITTLFTYNYSSILSAVNSVKKIIPNKSNIFIGGIAATLLADLIEKDTGIAPHKGLLASSNAIGYEDNINIDQLTPDYSILEQCDFSYRYPFSDSYISYTTRGCPNNCDFCAVNTLEPKYVNYLPLKKLITDIDQRFGQKTNLLLLDNNVLASSRLEDIIEEIVECGFFRGARLDGKQRVVDFNQGLDARFVTKKKMKLLSTINLKPARIAFDDIRFSSTYCKAIELAAENGIFFLSNYILFNHNDFPSDFYQRLLINIELNEKLGTSIYSFPMKYIPVFNTHRKHFGKNWTYKHLRGVQCILNATRGVVGPKRQFFSKAFGNNVDEFEEIILMPESYIIYRSEFVSRADEWRAVFRSLKRLEKQKFIEIIGDNKIDKSPLNSTKNKKIRNLLSHY